VKLALFSALLLLGTASAADGPSGPSAEFIRRAAVPLPSLDEIPDPVIEAVSRYRVVTIGEMHGTQEAPKFVWGLFKALSSGKRSVLLALEIPQAEQAAVNRFLEDGDKNALGNSPFFKDAFQDGRRSRAMADLLDRTRGISGAKVLCFDPGTENDAQMRDVRMAEILRAGLDQSGRDMAVVLAGNVHAAVSVGTPWDAGYRSMGYELWSQAGSSIKRSDIHAIRLRYHDGSAWLCWTNQPCGVRDLGTNSTPYSDAASAERYYLDEGKVTEGYGATFYARSIHASPPLVEPAK
jgi:hypothetical protein